jgi:hypothetical protein
MAEPKFVPIDLTEFVTSGSLLNVNETILWHLGLALTVDWDYDTHTATNLHVRQWEFEDGRIETIENDPDDVIALQRHTSFMKYVRDRAALMSPEEEAEALLLLDWSDEWDKLEDAPNLGQQVVQKAGLPSELRDAIGRFDSSEDKG